MTEKLRDTRYARELATVKLPSKPGRKSFVAIERIHVKQVDQVEIRFSSWEGTKMLPRPLDLPEEELLPLLKAALQAGVFSEAFTQELRRMLGGTAPGAAAAPPPATDLDKIQAHFHELIRSRAGDRLGAQQSNLPVLSRDQGSEDEPGWFPVEGMDGGFKYWWDAASGGLRLMSESWSKKVEGSGQLHEITPAGARLLGEGFI
jgi:hypothetical protein